MIKHLLGIVAAIALILLFTFLPFLPGRYDSLAIPVSAMAQEFVVYNPLDEHVMTVHAADILEMTPQQLALDRTRGHDAVNAAPQPHWKYFWFD